jgi:hypothetical protein
LLFVGLCRNKKFRRVLIVCCIVKIYGAKKSWIPLLAVRLCEQKKEVLGVVLIQKAKRVAQKVNRRDDRVKRTQYYNG